MALILVVLDVPGRQRHVLLPREHHHMSRIAAMPVLTYVMALKPRRDRPEKLLVHESVHVKTLLTDLNPPVTPVLLPLPQPAAAHRLLHNPLLQSLPQRQILQLVPLSRKYKIAGGLLSLARR
jgi:hypothetical protein